MSNRYSSCIREYKRFSILGAICFLGAATIICLLWILPQRQEFPMESPEPLLRPMESLKLPSETEYTHTQTAPAALTPVLKEVEGYPVMGCLTIEALGLELPVLAEFSYDGLETAPCLYAGSASPEYAGNIVIVGHNYKRHFSTLKKVETGQIVILLDKYGTKYEYQVYELVTIAPDQIETLEEYKGDRALSLLTCTDKGKKRLLVRCRPVL